MQECVTMGLTYSVPLKARLKLYCTDPEHEDFEEIVQDVYLGNIPYMTPTGNFVINGAQRVCVSQLHRSPGVFFGQSFHRDPISSLGHFLSVCVLDLMIFEILIVQRLQWLLYRHP